MKYMRLLISIALAQAAGIIGSLFTAEGLRSWYDILTKPTWNPPSWVFGPVWVTLYTLMGIAAYFIWERRKSDRRADRALTLYFVHLTFNAAWSVIFFGIQNVTLAFYWILALDVLIIATLVLFWRIRKAAGLLLLPYLAWTLFATYLNYSISVLN